MKKILNLKNVLFVLLFVFVIMSLASCGSSNSTHRDSNSSPIVNDVVESNGRKVVYNISYDYEGKEIKNTIKDVKNKIVEFGGYISESRDQEYYSMYYYKVPTDKVNELLDFIDSINGFSNKTVNTRDVTSTYNSVNSTLDRLNAKKKIYEDELNNNTSLTADEKLRYIDLIEGIDGQIQDYYSRKDQLEEELDYSTVSICYRADRSDEWIKKFGNIMLDLLKYIGVTVAITAPFAIAGGIVFIVIKKKKKKEE